MPSRGDIFRGILGGVTAVATGGIAGGVGYSLNLAKRRKPDSEAAPVIVRATMRGIAEPGDATRGAAFAASSIRLVLDRCIPDEALEWIDRFCARWTQLAYEPERVKSAGQKAYEDSPVSEGNPWDDVAPPTQQAWTAYAKRKGIE